jgi:hypothetical protein
MTGYIAKHAHILGEVKLWKCAHINISLGGAQAKQQRSRLRHFRSVFSSESVTETSFMIIFGGDWNGLALFVSLL